jgi:ATP-dependent RNA helicase HelY
VTSPSDFASRYPFELDPFQLDAIDALDQGSSVLVAAPTGAGKTVVAEYAIQAAVAAGKKAFYTTPLKALSNQKFGDLVARYGPSRVGLLTGDNSINSEAEIVVMTTEVLRNMLYERSTTLENLQWVVMDEVHYLQDPYRGAVWEEVLIHLPLSVGVVCLSATISNAEEFGEWIGTLRGPTRVVIEERRPVPLEHHYLVGHKLHPMHVEVDGHLTPNPYVVSMQQRELRVIEHQRRSSGRRVQSRHGRPREGHRGVFVPSREEVVEILDQEGMLPAIYFVFSRAGCDRAVRSVIDAGVRLTSHEESVRIREFAEMRAAWMHEEDLEALDFYDFVEGLAAGVASHHAGMLPLFKETVEELFEQALVKVVFATETLSLGINMPARTVVIEDLWKFQGERHELLTAGQYTQLTGRAGRRGIDDLGHAVVLLQPNVEFERVASLASTRTYELTSSFRPSYNMAVNLVRNYTREQTHQLLDSSFAQFLADRSVVTLQRQIDRDRETAASYREQAVCHLGDFAEYWGLKERAREIRDNAKRSRESARSDEIKGALAKLRPGDVVLAPGAHRRGLAVVVATRDGKPVAVSQDRKQKPFRLLPRDFSAVPEPVARVKLPTSGRAHSPKFRRDVASALASMDVQVHRDRFARGIDAKTAERAGHYEALAKEHPCHACAERADHERWALRASRLDAQTAKTERRTRARTETLGRRFDRVLAVLEELGYVRDFSVSRKGEMLSRIYGEADIVAAESIGSGLLSDLSGAETASLVSSLLYERRERFAKQTGMPNKRTVDRYLELLALWEQVRRTEDRHQVELCRELDPGFAVTVFDWAEGKNLESVLQGSAMTPGDFIRNCKQLIDLLRQMQDVAPDLAQLGEAREAVNRGVVAYTGV